MAVIIMGEVVSHLVSVTIVDQQSVILWKADRAVKRQSNIGCSGHGAADSFLQISRVSNSDFQPCHALVFIDKDQNMTILGATTEIIDKGSYQHCSGVSSCHTASLSPGAFILVLQVQANTKYSLLLLHNTQL